MRHGRKCRRLLSGQALYSWKRRRHSWFHGQPRSPSDTDSIDAVMRMQTLILVLTHRLSRRYDRGIVSKWHAVNYLTVYDRNTPRLRRRLQLPTDRDCGRNVVNYDGKLTCHNATRNNLLHHRNICRRHNLFSWRHQPLWLRHRACYLQMSQSEDFYSYSVNGDIKMAPGGRLSCTKRTMAY